MEKSKSLNLLPFTRNRRNRYQENPQAVSAQIIRQQKGNNSQNRKQKTISPSFISQKKVLNNNSSTSQKPFQKIQNQSTLNLLQKYEKNLVQIATEINKLHSVLGDDPSKGTNDFSTLEGILSFKNKYEDNQLRLPQIKPAKESNKISFLGDLDKNPSVILTERDSRIRTKNKIMFGKKKIVNQHYSGKNNPLFCVSKSQNVLDKSPDSQNIKENFSPPLIDKSQVSYFEGVSNDKEGRFAFKDLLKDKISKPQQFGQEYKKPLLSERISLQNSGKHFKNILKIDSKYEDEKTLSQPDSATSIHGNTNALAKHIEEEDEDDDDKYYDLSPNERDAAKWQEKHVLHDEKAIKRFYNNYRKIDKIQEIEQISPQALNQDKNPIIEYLKQVHKNNQMPHMLAFKKQQEDYSYNLKSFFINKNFAKAFSENLKSNQKLTSLVLSRNNLGDESFSQLIQNLPIKLQRLDISNNQYLTIKSYKLFKENLSDPIRRINSLSFEGNLMGDECCKEICEGIQNSSQVKILNLSKNQITDIGAQFISELICFDGCQLQSILLHWNQIRFKGSIVLAKALRKNYTVQIFDASFNSFGTGPLKKKKKLSLRGEDEIESPSRKTQGKQKKNQIQQKEPEFEDYTISAYQWNKIFITNKKLVHIDISFNSFKVSDIIIMGEGLKQNHTIMGIHMMGNEAKVDELGFLDPSNQQDHVVSHIFTRIPGVLKRPNVTNKNLIDLKVCSNCWICEGWTQIEFYVTINDQNAPYLHLNFEQFKPHRMEEDPTSPGTYKIFRMVPPGNLSYFYTDSQNKPFIDPYSQSIISQNAQIINDHISLNVPKMNYVENVDQLEKILQAEDLLSIKAIPRPEKAIQEEDQRPKSPWTLPKSIFANYKYDTDEILAKCFDFDWSCSKMDKLIKSAQDKEKIQEFLKNNYRAMQIFLRFNIFSRETYKYYSALGPSGNVFSIGTNVFSDIIFNCPGLLDSKNVKLSDVDLEFISTKAGNKLRSKNNPDRQIIRYQFLEIFVRLAIDKYYKTKICENYQESVIKFFQEHVLPFFRKYNSSDFRWQKFWNEPCDIVIKKNYQILKEIYTKHSGRDCMPGDLKHMSMNEFIDLVTRSGVVDDTFGAREIGVIYNLSMMTQIDEISKDRHQQMQFIEFIEAFGRVAERVTFQQSQNQEENNPLITEESQKTPRESSLQFYRNEKQNSIQPLFEINLDKKIQLYINRICLTQMGEEYAFQYERKLQRRETLRKQQLQKILQQQISQLIKKKSIKSLDKSADDSQSNDNGSFIQSRMTTPFHSSLDKNDKKDNKK